MLRFRSCVVLAVERCRSGDTYVFLWFFAMCREPFQIAFQGSIDDGNLSVNVENRRRMFGEVLRCQRLALPVDYQDGEWSTLKWGLFIV